MRPAKRGSVGEPLCTCRLLADPPLAPYPRRSTVATTCAPKVAGSKGRGSRRSACDTSDPVGKGNDAAILRAAREAKLVVCAWGNHGLHLERSKAVLDLLKKDRIGLSYLRLNSSGQPAHPLYLPGSLKPTAW